MSDVKNRTEVEQRKSAENSASTMDALCKAAYEGLLGAATLVPGVLAGAAATKIGAAAAKVGAEVARELNELPKETLILGALFGPGVLAGHAAAKLGTREAQKLMDAQKNKK